MLAGVGACCGLGSDGTDGVGDGDRERRRWNDDPRDIREQNMCMRTRGRRGERGREKVKTSDDTNPEPPAKVPFKHTQTEERANPNPTCCDTQKEKTGESERRIRHERKQTIHDPIPLLSFCAFVFLGLFSPIVALSPSCCSAAPERALPLSSVLSLYAHTLTYTYLHKPTFLSIRQPPSLPALLPPVALYLNVSQSTKARSSVKRSSERPV